MSTSSSLLVDHFMPLFVDNTVMNYAVGETEVSYVTGQSAGK